MHKYYFYVNIEITKQERYKYERKDFLLEDDAFLRDGLSEMLQKEGYITKCASTCGEAKVLLSGSRFNLIIFDVMLPDGSGLDLCTEIRKADTNIPILFLTACDDEIQIVRGLDAGADDYVTKPFKLQELLSEFVLFSEEIVI